MISFKKKSLWGIGAIFLSLLLSIIPRSIPAEDETDLSGLVTEFNLNSIIKLDFAENYMILRAGNWPDYQFLFFEKENNEWVYFDFLNTPGENYSEPEIIFLDRNFLYYKKHALSGTGVSYYLYSIYIISEKKLEHVFDCPANGRVDDWEMLFNREFDSTINYLNHDLNLNYKIKVTAASRFRYETSSETDQENLPLFEVNRKVIFNWDGRYFEIDKTASQLTLKGLDALFNGASEEYYKLFKPEFDNLKNGNPEQQRWYEEFMKETHSSANSTEKP